MFQDDRKATNLAAKLILNILDAGGYTAPSGQWVSTEQAQHAAMAGTTLYRPGDLEAPPSGRASTPTASKVEVVDATTQEAAAELAAGSAVVALNFASARNPGGGFLGGARAQEEELCRCSGLYRCLLTQPEYYRHHRAERSLLYSDHMIYSPGVPFVRVAAGSPLLEEPFAASVITAPSPNLGAIRANRPSEESGVQTTFQRRWGRILTVAAIRGYETVVLGAWGCGAFRNDPYVVAESARSALAGASDALGRVVFAIPNRGRIGAQNYSAFKSVLTS